MYSNRNREIAIDNESVRICTRLVAIKTFVWNLVSTDLTKWNNLRWLSHWYLNFVL
ncbi:MAG: hypothetical protein ACTS47_00220 [Candidatus Hodgkinia cicadicola]